MVSLHMPCMFLGPGVLHKSICCAFACVLQKHAVTSIIMSHTHPQALGPAPDLFVIAKVGLQAQLALQMVLWKHLVGSEPF